jgi:hypothetical protein
MSEPLPARAGAGDRSHDTSRGDSEIAPLDGDGGGKVVSISAELLERLARSTSKEIAAIERFLGITTNNGKRKMEPASDGVAVTLFALVNALESETNYRKAPVIRVFDLYCAKSLTRRKVAKACRCSLALVKIRLKAIQNKLGRKPAELRTLSSEFERIADSLRDSRASRINRERAIYGSDPEDDE